MFRKDCVLSIVILMVKFYKKFFKVYEEEELLFFDFDDVFVYDWFKFIKWMIRLDWEEKMVLFVIS